MNKTIRFALGLSALALAAQAAAQITFYEGEGYRGRAFTTAKQVGNFEKLGFNDRASSVVVDRGRWEVCEDVRFNGHCVVLREGSYDSLRSLGLENRISSVRPVDGRAHFDNEAPVPLAAAPAYEYRRRPNEAVLEAPVTSVRAVVGPPEQRCWVERQQVAEPQRRDPNIGGAVVGALLGGVLGHQVGGGRGKDLATVGGAVAGGFAGAQVNSVSGGGTVERDVKRCEAVASNAAPDYWDVTYRFRGVDHHVQMSAPPGRTVIVNRNGEPRQ